MVAGILTCCLVERRAPRESVEREALGDAGVKPVKRESEAVGQWLQSSSDQTWATSVDTRVEHGGKHRVPTEKLEKPCRLQRNSRRKDDIPTQLPAVEGLAHESQSSETVIDDIMTDVNVLRIDDGRVKARFIRESTRMPTWIQMRKESSRSREHNSTLTAILCHCRSVCSQRAKARAKTARTQGTNRPRK